MTENIETFGDRLKMLRKKSGLNQTELANLLGYDGNTKITNLERGKQQDLSVSMLDNLSVFFNCDLHWLITGKTAEPAKQQSTKDAEKIYQLEFIETKESIKCKGHCKGFASHELLGLLQLKIEDIYQQMNGKIKPTIQFERTFVEQENK